MTKEKVREVLAIYRTKFEELGISKGKSSHTTTPFLDEEFLSHCYGMLDEMEEFIQQDRMDKVFRWLGFVQGCLWTTGVYTIEAAKNHNRP
jgi:hypothetical protein